MGYERKVMKRDLDEFIELRRVEVSKQSKREREERRHGDERKM